MVTASRISSRRVVGGSSRHRLRAIPCGNTTHTISAAAHGYGLAWWEQVRVGGEITFRKHLIMGEKPEENRYGIHFSQLHALELADIDGDGLKDIVIGKRFWAHGNHGDPEPDAPAVIYWFQLVRNGKDVDFIPHLIDDNSGVGTQ